MTNSSLKSEDRIEALLNTPYWIIDILPFQVPKDSPGQYFAIEEYFLKEQLADIKRKHINLILKLNCYRDITIENELNPAPDGLRVVCAAFENDPEKIGIHMLEMLAKFRSEGIIS